MSRSEGAWEGRALITVVGCGGGRLGFGDRVDPGRRRLRGAVSSTKQLVELLAASSVVLVAVPAVALAGSPRASHARALVSHQRSVRVVRGDGVVLARGSGYASGRVA